nr:MAG TPA: hypothetical protein [Caudoviricetes sp.]
MHSRGSSTLEEARRTTGRGVTCAGTGMPPSARH